MPRTMDFISQLITCMTKNGYTGGTYSTLKREESICPKEPEQTKAHYKLGVVM